MNSTVLKEEMKNMNSLKRVITDYLKGKDLFAQMASFLDECFSQNLEE